MKSLKFFAVSIIVLITSCNDSRTSKVKSFMPGTYVSQWSDEFANTHDTLRIEKMTESGSSTYQITRHMLSLVKDVGNVGKRKYRIENWAGAYNANNQTILINNNGRVFSFDPDKNELLLGNTIYQKIK